MKDAKAKKGLTHQESFHKTSVDSLGMGAVGKKVDGTEPNKPAPNPSTKASRGHTIK